MDRCTMLVVGAGRGRRFGGELPKQYCLLRGEMVIVHTIRRLLAHPGIARVIPVIAPHDLEWWQMALEQLNTPGTVAPPVNGGESRQESVFNGLMQADLPPEAWIGIHDAARPLVGAPLLDRLLTAPGEARIPVWSPPDTVKRLHSDGTIQTTLDRERIGLAQTPQLFRYGVILAAHHRARAEGFQGTDDASLVERLGQPVHTLPGDPHTLKITHAEDLDYCAYLLDRERRP